MGVIENTCTGDKIYIRSHHLFGRNKEKADTELKSHDISHIHATIRWDGREWMLNDLSRNGVWLNDVRIVPGKNIRLTVGNIIRFSNIEQVSWKIIDLEPPVTVLIPLHENSTVIKLNMLHVLPDESMPDISVYISNSGQWVYENEKETIPLQNGDVVSHHSGSWQFFCAEPVESTFVRKRKEHNRFIFDVSLNEEHVIAKIQAGEQIIDLGERVHHYLLLTLARQRLKDAEKGVDLETQGWIGQDSFADLLGVDPSYLNIQVYRARKQIASNLSNHMSFQQVVERRFGELRFGFPDFQIKCGSSVEGALSQGELYD